MYIKYWCTVTNVNEAPFNDINLIRSINTYKSYNKRIAEAYFSKIFKPFISEFVSE